ncbi:DUF4785 domain-containing protein [Natronospira bacteriovora]|uniref:DUF4785 family protein n=1 Tax=Natronospira bacteriovora TaxID=3069753 RepID=A0ABU0W9D0_9GAMM|nr:DUF4785 domain-containing protein [Natronospira sp. AB-CW4]MDQ2070642.1 DUF4785 family protein [Natronospira sp. AB-CW4]
MTFRIACIFLTLALGIPAVAQEARLLPASDKDFRVSGQIMTLRDGVTRAEGMAGEDAAVFMPARGEPVSSGLQAPQNDSRSYTLRVAARELASGVSLPLTAPGAIVRLAPVPGSGGRTLQGDDIQIRQGPWVLEGREAARDLASGPELAAAAPVFSADTVALRLSDRIVAGEAVLQVRESALLRGGRYHIHVFEADSPVRARIGADSPLFALGEAMSAEGRIEGMNGVRLSRVEGVLISPDGQRRPVQWTPGEDGTFASALRLPRQQAGGAGLWELEAQLEGRGENGPVRRDVRLAFDVVAPTARLNGHTEVVRQADGWRLLVGVDVASPGRYELRAGLDRQGTAHSARWLEAGRHVMELTFPGALPQRALLRDVRLIDQSRMALLHVQSDGVAVSADDADHLPGPRLGL